MLLRRGFRLSGVCVLLRRRFRLPGVFAPPSSHPRRSLRPPRRHEVPPTLPLNLRLVIELSRALCPISAPCLLAPRHVMPSPYVRDPAPAPTLEQQILRLAVVAKARIPAKRCLCAAKARIPAKRCFRAAGCGQSFGMAHEVPPGLASSVHLVLRLPTELCTCAHALATNTPVGSGC